MAFCNPGGSYSECGGLEKLTGPFCIQPRACPARAFCYGRGMAEKAHLIRQIEDLLNQLKDVSESEPQSKAPPFDLVPIEKSKEAVDISPNTIRKYFKQGLKTYKREGVHVFSRSELDRFLKEKGGAFDFVRITHAKETVDFSPDTIRSFFKKGLKKYTLGDMTMFRKSELQAFLIANAKVE